MNDLQDLHSPLFAGLPPEQVEQIMACMQRRSLAPGEILGRENEPGSSFYLILSGEIEAIKAIGTPEERVLGLRSRGDFLGEASMFEWNSLRMATLRAYTQAEVLEMSHHDFEKLLRSTPALAYEVARQVSLRQRRSDNASIQALQRKNAELAQAYAELKDAQVQIIEKEKLQRELQLARQIQFSILPQTLSQPQGWEIGAVLEPARFVGGDLYDVISLGEDNLGLMIGDVSDKGVPAGLFMALARSLLRAESRREADPFEVLQHVNANLLEMNQAGMFVTMLYGLLNLRSGAFHYVRAGHELPLLLEADGRVLPARRSQGMALGLFPDPVLDVQTLHIPPGGALLLYTDGAADAINPQGERYGLERFQRSLVEHLHLHPAQLVCERLAALLQAYHQGEPQADDITLLMVRNLTQ